MAIRLNNSRIMYKYSSCLRALPLVLGAFCVLSLLYLGQFCRFNMPANDDYGYILSRIKGNSPIDIAITTYNGWNGRLVANFFYSLFLPNLDFDLYRITTFICFLAFCISFVALVWALNLKTTVNTKIYIALLPLVSICVSASYLHDIFFWMGGITNYLLPVIFLTVAYIFVVKKVKNVFLRILWAVLSFVLVSLSSMCSEAFSLAAIWFSFVLTCVFILKRDRRRGFMTAVFTMILITGLMVMYFSPGTFVREAGGDVEDARKLFWALRVSLMSTFERGGEWLLLSQIIPAALLADIALKDVKLPLLSDKISLRKQGIFLIIFGITCAWAAHFTISYALGYYGLPGRAKFVAQYFLQIPAMAGFICIARSLRLNEKSKTAAIAAILFVLMIIPSKHFSPSIFYIGSFSDYYNTLRDRHNYLRVAQDDVVIFAASEKAPPVISYPFFKNDCNPDDSLHKYYKKACIKLDGRNDGYNNYPALWTVGK